MSAELDRARILVDLRRYEAARAELSRTLAAAPDDAEALTLLAVADLGLRSPHEAVEHSAAALRADPESPSAWRLLALSSIGSAERLRTADRTRWRQLREQSRAAARRAVELGPHDARNYRVLAIVLEQADREAALHAVTRALELAPDHADLHVLHAGMLRRSPGDTTKQTEAAAREALRLDPENIDALDELASNDIVGGRVRAARQKLRRVAELDPSRGSKIRGQLEILRHGVLFSVVARILNRSGRVPRKMRIRRRVLLAVLLPGYLIVRVLMSLAGCSGYSSIDDPYAPPPPLPSLDPWPTFTDPTGPWFTIQPDPIPAPTANQ